MSQTKEVVVKFDVGGEEIKLSPKIVQEYLTGGQPVTMPEFKMFTELCKARKLNPFLREAYIIKFGSQPATIVVGKDAILKRAINHPEFNGREQGIIALNEKGEAEERKGAFYAPGETVIGGWAKVYRKGWDHPTYITVSLEEAIQRKKDGTPNQNWANKPATMIEKVALVRALRETFVEDLGGMIDEDEAWKREDAPRASQSAPVQQSDPMSDVVEAEVEEINMEEIPV